MFAYCENNCINKIDPCGDWFFSLTEYYNYYNKKSAGVGNINFQASYNKIKSRYYNNLSLLRVNNSYIFGQRITPFANIKYGYYNQKISGVGCELVAIYNTLKFIKKPGVLLI